MPEHATDRPVDATGTRRRVQALARRLAGGQVPPDFADRVRRLYDQLWNVTPVGLAADRARAAARRFGWVSPLAWDDHEIDVPAATPDLGERTGTRAQALTEDSDWLLRFGYPFDVAAERLGITPASLKRARERAREAARQAVAA
jgi:hypothetical protein